MFHVRNWILLVLWSAWPLATMSADDLSVAVKHFEPLSAEPVFESAPGHWDAKDSGTWLDHEGR
jgi:hypothetical protein